jgi:TonB-dependent Receptor Plug Domain
VKVTLEVGSFTDTIEVKGGSELIQTQSGAVSSTLMTEQLKTIRLPTRNALYAVNLLPGVDTTGTVRESTINGLPEQTINITLDGVNVNNNQDKAGDGFYAMVRPQLDAIEQVTLTTAAQGAESAGQGAVQIRFVTRSGTNSYRGTIYDYMRHPSLNTNSWINEKNNLDKNRIILHQAEEAWADRFRFRSCTTDGARRSSSSTMRSSTSRPRRPARGQS